MFRKRKSKNPRYDLGKVDNLNQREFSIIQHGLSEGIAKISLVEKKKKAFLVADVTGLLSLNKFLEGVISTSVFFKLVEGITLTILRGKKELLQEQGFDISFDHIYVSGDTKAITLVYWPSLDFKSSVGLDSFFIQLLNKAKLDNQGDDDNVRRYIEFFGSSRVFSLQNFAKLIASIQNIDLSGIISDSKELFTLGINDKQGGTGNTDSSRRLGATETNYVPEFKKTENLMANKASTSHVSEATTVLGVEPEVVVACLRVQLKRLSTGSEIVIDRSDFTIGKQGCDYNIIDNNAISRQHARIDLVDESVSITDLNSSNGIKINGKRIDVGVSALLQSGDVLSLANEDFSVGIGFE